MCENEPHWGRSKRYVSLKEAENGKFRQCVNENGQNSIDFTGENLNTTTKPLNKNPLLHRMLLSESFFDFGLDL